MRKNNINLRILFIMLLSTVMINTQAQTGLNFQGVARGSNNVILVSQQISLRLSILQGSATGSVEYTETRKVTTNAQGLFTVVIGDADATSTMGNFSSINWKNTPKYLKIEMDAAAGNNFITMGTTQFQYVAYAQYAKTVDAENIEGILPVSKGGTGLSSNAALKSALSLDKINNTADADKPISTKTQTALDLILVTASDTTRFSNRINLKANTTDVNLITTTLGTKLNAADTIKFTKQIYSDSSLLTKLKIADTASMFSSRIKRDTLSLSNRINLKGNAADITSGLALKENTTNKSTASDLGGVSPSDVLYPTQKAVKEYVAANAGSGGVADGGITNIKLADGAVTYAKFQTIPTNTILGNTSSSTTSVQAIATTGSDNVVLSTSPTISSPILITPNIGAATASSINNVTINGFNFKSDVPSLTITGTTTLQGNNTGDDATNSKYEGLLTNGIVDLNTDQAIDGKKTFLNNITMANLLGVGSITPTTINFANGSKMGDIQNINGGEPDSQGSIDLYAPDGAKWVQMNYGNTNYIGLGQYDAIIEIGNNYWKFNNDGSTELPVGLKIQKDEGTPEIISDQEIAITSKDYLRLRFDDNVSYTRLGISKDEAELYIYNDDFSSIWNYKVDGSSWFPGDLNFTDKHAINFTSSGNSTPTNNASIISTGPLFKIQTREVTETEYDEELNYGIELNYTDRNIFELRKYTYFLNHDDDDSNDDYWSAATFAHDNFNFLINKNSSQYRWQFNDDGSTILPGALLITGNIETTGTLKLGNTLFPSVSGNPNDVLTIDGITGNAIWKASSGLGQPLEIDAGNANYGMIINTPSTNSWGSGIGFNSSVDNPTPNKALFQLDGVGNMVFRTLQNGMYFDNFGNGDINFRIRGDGVPRIGYYLDEQLIEHDVFPDMTFKPDGNLSINGNVNSTSFIQTSDIRLKKNINLLQNSLSIIKKLSPVSYDKKKSIYGDDYSIKENGFIAQELQKILPDLVHESPDKDKLLSVNYTAIIPILTKGIQEQQVIIEDQKKRLEALEKLVSDLINKK